MGGFELDNTLSTTTDIMQMIPTSNSVSIWYLTRLLPLHLMSARLLRDAATILLDKRFSRYRYTACGVIEVIKLYIQESLVFLNIIGQSESCRSSKPNSVGAEDNVINPKTLPEDVGNEVKDTLYDAIREFFQKEKMHFVQTTTKADGENNYTRQTATDFADALYYLGAAFGKEL